MKSGGYADFLMASGKEHWTGKFQPAKSSSLEDKAICEGPGIWRR
jgi:hypothetical protein